MKIDNSFQGAAAARNMNRFKDSDVLQQNARSMAGKEIEVQRNGESVILSFSDEMVDFSENVLSSIFDLDYNVQHADPSDVFSYRPQDQWLVFSQFLNDSHFYDSLSTEELNQIENVLKQITDGLDSLTSTGVNLFGGVKTQLDSYEAQLELASSTSALQLFSQTVLSGDIKAGFDRLIDQYAAHNEAKIRNYQSIEEKFYAARSKIAPTNASLTASQAQHLSMTNKLGRTTASGDEIEAIVQMYARQFKEIQDEESLSLVIEQLKEQLVAFATRGIASDDPDYEAARQFIEQRSQDTFGRIGQYWNVLLAIRQ
ncbi:hypothetical protein DUZ99_07575 [Xylanibacillus composti]|uniref:Uncharacterized protein n=1 Tax=Xylanibacillus composti TaxID=1572762 RepID=A0A8J4H5H7_9BACL|nr:hypothetical protein [Xylanibacillus composti]MDT9724852.1 hypothetical protein [Xylanibacillus composti]GIQ69053.1 hypothetical protein XYCOK13_18770 [Xylanibacillus composti]